MSSSNVTPLVLSRRALRRARLLALYEVADGSPGPRMEIALIAPRAHADAEQVLAQLLVLESLGLTNDVGRSGAALTGAGAVLAERLLLGEDLAAGSLQ